MVDRISTRMGSVVRPGVFVSQTAGLSGPQPLSNHAIGYLYATVDEEYDNLRYSSLLPYTPTQILSLQDYAVQAGGVPTSIGSRVSYDSVNAFFQNVGPNGILYVTRVVPTPETVLSTKTATFGYKYFALKINGKYVGNVPTGEIDTDEDEIFVIETTGIDPNDNALDVFRFLDSDTEFNYSFKAEQDGTDLDPTLNQFRIFSKDPTELVSVDSFKAYKNIEDIRSATNEVDLGLYTKSYAPSKDLVVKLNSRDSVSGKEVFFVNGEALKTYSGANAAPADDTAFLTSLVTYIEDGLDKESELAVGQYVAVSKDTTGYYDSHAGYRKVTSVSPLTLSDDSAGLDIASANLITRTGYLPDSVQVLYVEIAGENRVVIINGNGVKELGDDLTEVLKEVFEEKGILPYYDIENVSAYGSDTSYLPNNGYSLTSNTLADHGFPASKPSLDGALEVGTIDTAGIDLGTKTLTLTTDLAIGVWDGAVIYIGANKYTVSSSTATTITTVESLVEVEEGDKVFLDNSEANGFYNFDYILKIRITSKNGAKPPVYPGLDRDGVLEDSIAYLPSPLEQPNYSTYKYSDRAKAQDFVYAITNSLEKKIDAQPGLIFAPEAYATIVAGVDGNSKAEARELRLRVSSAIATVAEGRLNVESSASSQHIGLIDCGGDVLNIQDARTELTELKSKVGSAFGHLSYYAPHVINSVGNTVPLSPYVAGIACSRYLNEGFQQAPAGSRYPLRDASGLSFTISSQQQEVTYALGLNPARELPNRGIVVWGARTISSNPLFKFVSTRAILNVLLDVLNRSFDDILFEQISSSEALFTRVRTTAVTVLQQFYNRGAFFGNSPSEAYRVICDSTNNTDDSLESGSLACDIFVATSPTLERLFISVVRTPAGQIALISDNRLTEAVRANQIATTF